MNHWEHALLAESQDKLMKLLSRARRQLPPQKYKRLLDLIKRELRQNRIEDEDVREKGR